MIGASTAFPAAGKSGSGEPVWAEGHRRPTLQQLSGIRREGGIKRWLFYFHAMPGDGLNYYWLAMATPKINQELDENYLRRLIAIATAAF